MKLYKMFIVFPLLGLLIFSCKSKVSSEGDAATSTSKDEEVRQYNLDVKKEQTTKRFPCDTIALKEYILDHYEPGSYLMQFAKTFTYNVPHEAVIYFRDSTNYVLALIARSKSSERNIEQKNVGGFSSSYVNLDSTKLGTAFFWLTLFECKNDEFNKVWESEVPIHGGFNRMSIKLWKPKNMKYVELNYEDGIISGHRNYNFFLTDGWQHQPHLLETYEGIAHKRTMANVNNDKFPDYFEYRFTSGQWADSLAQIRILDSIPFYWSTRKQLYITDKNPRWFRKY